MMVSIWWLLAAVSLGVATGMVLFALMAINPERRTRRPAPPRPLKYRQPPVEDLFGGPTTVM